MEKNESFKFIAMDKAGRVYEAYIKNMEQSIMAATVSPDAEKKLEEIRQRLLDSLAVVQNEQARIHSNKFKK